MKSSGLNDYIVVGNHPVIRSQKATFAANDIKAGTLIYDLKQLPV